MNIGEQINNLRKQHGLSQDDFANLFNVSRQTISNWENGKSYPDLEMIIKVSDYFKISIDELLKNDVQTVKKIDNEKKAKKKQWPARCFRQILDRRNQDVPTSWCFRCLHR